MHHRGQQRRVALAQNLVHLRGLHPRLLQQPEGLARIHRPQLRRVAHQGHARHPEPVRDPEQRLHATFDDGTDTSPEFNETIGDATVTIPEIGILEAVARSVAHVAERRTAIPEAEIRAVALSHASGRYTLAEVDGAIDRLVRGGELIEVERRGMDRAFVTDRAVKAERRILASMRAGRGQGKALRTADGVEARLGGTRLTKGQQEAVRTVLLSENRIVGVQGHAGSGKTTMLREVKELLAGRRIQGLAPSAAAARVLGREAGIPSTTLQYFLTRYGDLSDPERLDRARAEYRGAVLAVDESSMIDTVR